jgi:hypothetical protein
MFDYFVNIYIKISKALIQNNGGIIHRYYQIFYWQYTLAVLVEGVSPVPL